jgi:hypothetical protein
VKWLDRSVAALVYLMAGFLLNDAIKTQERQLGKDEPTLPVQLKVVVAWFPFACIVEYQMIRDKLRNDA